MESDAQQIVLSIQSKDEFWSSLGLIIADCQQLVSGFAYLHLCFVRRSANSAAHMLARHAHFVSDLVEWGSAPFFLFDVISHDSVS